jgi:hypothetical protein
MPISVSYIATGTCFNYSTGSVQIVVSGGTPPYFYTWTNPSGFTSSYLTELGPGSYSLIVNDSQAPTNNTSVLGVSVSSGMCLSLASVTNTTCGLNNGRIIVVAESDNYQITYNLLDVNDVLIESQFINEGNASFTNLSAGTYYVQSSNMAGCTAKTESIIVGSGNTLDFGFYVVDDTQCDPNPTGKLFVTGLTGEGPFNIQWSNAQTGSTITGLTAGLYSCTVTSSDFCELNKNVFVGYQPQLGLNFWSAITPTCSSSDGQLILSITGGTGPYYYSASNGSIEISYSQVQTYTGLTTGPFSVLVTDATFCKQTFSTTLQITNSINYVDISSINSICSVSGGSVSVLVYGGTAPYTYTISSSTFNKQVTTNSSTNEFTNLFAGTYEVSVSNIGNCFFTKQIEIFTDQKFISFTSVTGGTCGADNGKVEISITSGGTPPYVYSLSNGFTTQSNDNKVVFEGLVSGFYQYQVVDDLGCSQSGTINVSNTPAVNFELYPLSCINGVDGTITVLLSSGVPPFTFLWSNNVTGNPQEVYITGLTKGVYTLNVTDANNCSFSAETIIDCIEVFTGYEVFSMTNKEFLSISSSKRGMIEMINEGYLNLINGYSGCTLSATTFTIQTNLNGNLLTNQFYTGYTLTDVPNDEQWYSVVRSMTLPFVNTVTINPDNSSIVLNQLTSNTNRTFKIDLILDYVIYCLPTP